MNLKTALLPLALATLAGCAGFTVVHDYDTHANYASYKTYDWYAAGRRAQGKAEGVENPIMDRRVRAAVERELAAKGFQMKKEGDPDFLVTYYPAYRNGTSYTTTTLGGWGGRRWGYGVGTQFTEARPFREGTIVLEIVDAKSNQLVWRSAAEGALTGLADPEDAEAQVTDAVRKMLARFPPPAR